MCDPRYIAALPRSVPIVLVSGPRITIEIRKRETERGRMGRGREAKKHLEYWCRAEWFSIFYEGCLPIHVRNAPGTCEAKVTLPV